MSCEQRTNKIARFVCQISSGIAQLSSKQAFYAGVAVGVSGTSVGALALTKRRQVAQWLGLAPKVKISGPRQAIAKPKPRPLPGLSDSGPKQGPKPIPGLTAAAQQPKPIPTLAASEPPQTKLQAAPVQLRDHTGQLVTSKNSYRVVRPDGSETGLAITPYLEQGQDRAVESETAWGVTHTGTGALIEGPFDSIAQAQGLATELSPLRWTASPVPRVDVDRAKQIIDRYRPARREETSATAEPVNEA